MAGAAEQRYPAVMVGQVVRKLETQHLQGGSHWRGDKEVFGFFFTDHGVYTSVQKVYLNEADSPSANSQPSLHLAIAFDHSQPAPTDKEPRTSLHMPSAHLETNKSS